MTLAIAPKRSSRVAVFATEGDLVDLTLRKLHANWPIRASATEVRSHGRCRADICVRVRDVAAPPGTDLLVGIEAKLTDWQRALRQAALNRFAVDASFVVMPSSHISDSLLTYARESGVGVLAIAGGHLDLRLQAQVCTPDIALRMRVEAQLKPTKARGRTPVGHLVGSW